MGHRDKMSSVHCFKILYYPFSKYLQYRDKIHTLVCLLSWLNSYSALVSKYCMFKTWYVVQKRAFTSGREGWSPTWGFDSNSQRFHLSVIWAVSSDWGPTKIWWTNLFVMICSVLRIFHCTNLLLHYNN